MSHLRLTLRQDHLLFVFHLLFDRHPSHIAMLDPQSQILAVNDSWQRFGNENGLRPDYQFVGLNYLRICERGAHQGDIHAAHAMVGLLDVLYHKQNKYEQTYPCHGPTEEQWFKLWIESQSPYVPVIILAHQRLTDDVPARLHMKTSNEPTDLLN